MEHERDTIKSRKESSDRRKIIGRIGAKESTKIESRDRPRSICGAQVKKENGRERKRECKQSEKRTKRQRVHRQMAKHRVYNKSLYLFQ